MDKRLQKIEASLGLISKSIASLPTRDEMNTAISTAVSNLPTRDEMNTAIENSFDDLARMVAGGFAGVDKRFDDMDKKFTEKFDNLEQKVDRNHTGLSKQLEFFSQNYTARAMHEGLDLRVKRLEKVC